jgi:hypothetical protein
MSERDPLVDKLHARERGEEDVFFARRDQELMARWRTAAERARRADEPARGRCPACGGALAATTRHDVPVDACPDGHGLWVTETALHDVAARQRDSWIRRYLYPPHPIDAA